MNKTNNLEKGAELDREPWVYIPTKDDLSDWGQEKSILFNQQNRHKQKYQHYINTFDFLNENKIIGDYFEFGCHKVRTFRMALTEAYRHSMEEMKFLAFDSFEGLPEATSSPSQENWLNKGFLSTSEEDFMSIIRAHGIYTEKVKTFKGYYEKSLNENLKQELSPLHKIAFICIDCDLYESAVDVFNFIDPFLQIGSCMYIDDYFTGYKGQPDAGVALAFKEYCSRSKYSFIPHMNIGWWGKSFIVSNKV